MYLVGGASGGDVVEFLGVESETEGGTDTRAEEVAVTQGENASVVDLGLHESSIVEVAKTDSSVPRAKSAKFRYLRLSSDLKDNTTVGRLGVVEGLGTSFSIAADAVIVAGSVGVQVVEGLKGDSIFGSIVTDGSGIAGDVALSDVVSGLSTEEEAVTANDSIGGEGGALE